MHSAEAEHACGNARASVQRIPNTRAAEPRAATSTTVAQPLYSCSAVSPIDVTSLMKYFTCIRFITLFITLFAVAADARAQSDPESTSDSPHRLADDAWALQFGVSSHTLSPLIGSTITAKHHFSDSRALRYGLGVRAHYRDQDDNRTLHNVDVSLIAQYMAYPTVLSDPNADIHLFYGIGPEVRFLTRSSGPNDETTVGLGAAGSIGAEWFVKTRISLTAEYMTTAAFMVSNRIKEFSLQPAGGRLGVSVYF